MFATIIIVLPTMYRGGEVRVVHGREEKTFDYASTSQFSTSVLAWYVDILHEVRPITSGHRLALSYNLIQPNRTPVVLPPPALSTTSKLGKILSDWSNGALNSPPGFICYMLKHEYSLLNLTRGIASLNGVDAHKIARIRQTAEGLGICFGFGQLVLHIVAQDEEAYGYGSYYKRRRYNGYGDDEDVYRDRDGEEIERTMVVIGLLDLDGNTVLSMDKKIPVDGTKTVLVPKDAFRGVKPDEVKHTGYTGNVSQLPLHLCLSISMRELL